MLSKTDYPRIFLQAEGFARGSEVPNNGSIIGNWNGLAPARGNWVAGFTITFPNVFDFKALSAEKQMAKANENSQQALYDKTIQDLTGQVQSSSCAAQEARNSWLSKLPLNLAAARASETPIARPIRCEFGDILWKWPTAEGLAGASGNG